MTYSRAVIRIPAAVLLLVAWASASEGQTAAFSRITDAAPGRFFDAATTAPDPNQPNTLVLGFSTGRDPRNWKDNDFRASTAAYSHDTAMDTIGFVVDAPAGYTIARITYTQRGTGSRGRTGQASGATQWTVGDRAEEIGEFAISPELTATADLSHLSLTSVPVSITTALFAYATPISGHAVLTITGADVVVELQEIVPEAPIPDAPAVPAAPADPPAPPADPEPPAPPADGVPPADAPGDPAVPALPPVSPMPPADLPGEPVPPLLPPPPPGGSEG
jgi:hypothetical protein